MVTENLIVCTCTQSFDSLAPLLSIRNEVLLNTSDFFSRSHLKFAKFAFSLGCRHNALKTSNSLKFFNVRKNKTLDLCHGRHEYAVNYLMYHNPQAEQSAKTGMRNVSCHA